MPAEVVRTRVGGASANEVNLKVILMNNSLTGGFSVVRLGGCCGKWDFVELFDRLLRNEKSLGIYVT